MLVFQGPTWYKARNGPVLAASLLFDGSRSRKTAGSLAETLQCNILHHRDRSTPPWWRETGESGTKQLYQPEPKPVVYIVPITSILGRLPLIPVGDHSTIPAAMSNRKRELFEYGKCDEVGHPGNGSKLY